MTERKYSRHAKLVRAKSKVKPSEMVGQLGNNEVAAAIWRARKALSGAASDLGNSREAAKYAKDIRSGHDRDRGKLKLFVTGDTRHPFNRDGGPAVRASKTMRESGDTVLLAAILDSGCDLDEGDWELLTDLVSGDANPERGKRGASVSHPIKREAEAAARAWKEGLHPAKAAYSRCCAREKSGR